MSLASRYMKYLFTLSIIYVAIYFFILGYNHLNKLSLNQPIIKINLKDNISNNLKKDKNNLENNIIKKDYEISNLEIKKENVI